MAASAAARISASDSLFSGSILALIAAFFKTQKTQSKWSDTVIGL